MIDRLFLLFMIVVGAATGIVAATRPDMTELVPSFFMILLAAAGYEGVRVLARRGRPDAIMAMEMRFFGFAIAILVNIVVAWALAPAVV